MKEFFKIAFATMLGVLMYSILASLLFFFVLGIMISAMDTKGTTIVEPNSLLMITLDAPIKDRASNNPFDNFNFQSFKKEGGLALNDIIKNIDKAKTDENIKGIYLDLSTLNAGIAQIEEIREALIKFKEGGKFIFCHADYFSQLSYYLASVSNNLYLTPTGGLDFIGFSLQVMFYKNAFDKIGVEPQIIRHGKFKSAVEPFMLNEMSPENTEQLKTYLFSIWNHYLGKISISRNIPVNHLSQMADSLSIATSNDALKYKLVDGLKYKDEIQKELATLMGTESHKDIKVITLADYDNAIIENTEDFKLIRDKVAIIYAIGEIGMGEGDTYKIGAEGLSKTIREAREDENIKAIVLRINSPGGSALASEIIWREVMLAKEAKPVVVSMGVYAASGGYYIACAADKIVACPNTLTGSIGVFGILFNAKQLLNDKIGITVNTVNTNKHSDIGAMYRAMLPEEQKYIQFSVEDVYATFIQRVADGRKMTTAQVDSIGQGRIWSGLNAIEIGLVDTLGTLQDAVNIAVKLADLKEYQTVDLPEQKEMFDEIMKQISTDVRLKFAEALLGQDMQIYQTFNEIQQYQGIQARMPFYFQLK